MWWDDKNERTETIDMKRRILAVLLSFILAAAPLTAHADGVVSGVPEGTATIEAATDDSGVDGGHDWGHDWGHDGGHDDGQDSEVAGGGDGGRTGGGDGGVVSIAPLASVNTEILEMQRRLLEAFFDFLYGVDSGNTPPPWAPGVEMDTGVVSELSYYDLDVEYPGDPPGAKFVISARDFENVSYVHLTFSYDYERFSCAYRLSDDLISEGFIIDESFTKGERDGDIIRTSLYLTHASYGGIASGGAAVELLHIYLVPKNVPYVGAATVALDHLDITYFEGGSSIDADVTFFSIVAAAWVTYFSIYDVNRDGMITIVDIDTVNRNLGMGVGSPGWEDDVFARRCDVNRDGVVNYSDLIVVIAAYEYALLLRAAPQP